jgi:hypothetical protein
MNKTTTFWLSVKSLLPDKVKKYPVKIKVINLSIILLSLFFISCEKEMQNLSIPYEQDGRSIKTVVICETPLIAAQNITAGIVTASFNAAGNQLTITYSIVNFSYCLTETHLDVEADPVDFPQSNSGKPKVGQIVQEAQREFAGSGQIVQGFPAESEILDHVHQVLQTRSHEIGPIERILTDEEAERGFPLHALRPVAGGHGKFVEIGDELGTALLPKIHAGSSRLRTSDDRVSR